MALGEGDRQDPMLQHCHLPKGGGFCWKFRWSMAVTALRTTLGFVGSRVEKWHLGGKLFRAGLLFTVASLRAGTLGQKQHFTTSPFEHPGKIVLQLGDNMELFKRKPLILSRGALWSESLESQTCSNAGQLRSFQTLVFLPEVAAASFAPLHWKTNRDKFSEIMKLTFTPVYSSVKWRHQCDKMISKVPSALTETKLWFWWSLSVRLSHCSQILERMYIVYLEAEHLKSFLDRCFF